MVISDIVTPLCCNRALLLRTCPMKATKTVTKDNSIDFAKAVYRVDAVRKGTPPRETLRPYCIFLIAITSQIPENTVE